MTDREATKIMSGVPRWILCIGLLALFFTVSWYLQNRLDFGYLLDQESSFKQLKIEHPWLMVVAGILLYAIVAGLSIPAGTVLTIGFGWYFGFWLGLLVASFGSTAGAEATGVGTTGVATATAGLASDCVVVTAAAGAASGRGVARFTTGAAGGVAGVVTVAEVVLTVTAGTAGGTTAGTVTATAGAAAGVVTVSVELVTVAAGVGGVGVFEGVMTAVPSAAAAAAVVEAAAQWSEIMVSALAIKLLSATAEVIEPLALWPTSFTSWPRWGLRSTPLGVILTMRPVWSSATV